MLKMQLVVVFFLLFVGSVNLSYAFGNWYVFGDSLSDNGNIPKLTGYPLPPSPYVGNRFSNGPVWAEYFSHATNFSFTPNNDYAVGGAFTGPISAQGLNGQPGTFNNLQNTSGSSFSSYGLFSTPQLPSFTQEVEDFAASGNRFQSNDLVGVWIGANNFFITAQQAAAFASGSPNSAINSGISATLYAQMVQAYLSDGQNAAMNLLVSNAVQTDIPQVTQGINELSQLGARQMVVLTLPPINLTPYAIQSGTQAQSLADGYTQFYNNYLQQSLASIHNQTGMNIITLNGQVLFNELVSNPAGYGIVNTGDQGMLAYLRGDTNYSRYLFWDGVHPTTYTHSIIAQYVSSAVKNFYSLTDPYRLLEANSDSFSSLVESKINSHIVKNPGTSNNDSLNFYITGNYNSGWRDDSDSTIGFNYIINTFALGADYWVTPNLLFGASIGYGSNYANLNDTGGTLEANVFQPALYGLYKLNNFFLSAQFDYGIADFTKISHPGVISSISNSDVKGNYINFNTTAGYTVKLNNLSLVPHAGISETNTFVDAYELMGDPVLNMSVSKQELSRLLSTLGLTAQYDFEFGLIKFRPSATVEMKSKLNNSDGAFDSYFTDEPTIALTSKYPDYSRNWAVAKFGLNTQISNRVSADIDYSSTFDNNSSWDRSIWAQVSYKF
jgi:phospholipase/lecithinase/hemolysin/uncharacterized protein YhjY with autotransporter beta-barrel domain